MATAPAVLCTSISPTGSLPPLRTDLQFFPQKQPVLSALYPWFYAWFHSRRKTTAGDMVWPWGCWWLPSFAATQHPAWHHIHSGSALGTQSPHPAQPPAMAAPAQLPPGTALQPPSLNQAALLAQWALPVPAAPHGPNPSGEAGGAEPGALQQRDSSQHVKCKLQLKLQLNGLRVLNHQRELQVKCY